MGSIYNLVDWWEPYKASKAALNNTIQNNNIKKVVGKNTEKLQVHNFEIIIYFTEINILLVENR